MEYDFKLSNDHVRVADDGALIVSGWASNFDVDRVGDQVTREALRKALDNYMRNPVVLYDHKYSQPAGVVTKARVDERKGLWVEVRLPEPTEDAGLARHYWRLVKGGVMRALSIGGRWTRERLADGTSALTDIDLREISIASVGVNANTLLSAQTAKAFQAGADADYLRNARVADIDRRIARLKRTLLHAEIVL